MWLINWGKIHFYRFRSGWKKVRNILILVNLEQCLMYFRNRRWRNSWLKTFILGIMFFINKKVNILAILLISNGSRVGECMFSITIISILIYTPLIHKPSILLKHAKKVQNQPNHQNLLNKLKKLYLIQIKNNTDSESWCCQEIGLRSHLLKI